MILGIIHQWCCVNQVTDGNKSHVKRSCRNCELMSQDKRSIESLIRLSV